MDSQDAIDLTHALQCLTDRLETGADPAEAEALLIYDGAVRIYSAWESYPDTEFSGDTDERRQRDAVKAAKRLLLLARKAAEGGAA